jgi:hypothetical protein
MRRWVAHCGVVSSWVSVPGQVNGGGVIRPGPENFSGRPMHRYNNFCKLVNSEGWEMLWYEFVDAAAIREVHRIQPNWC